MMKAVLVLLLSGATRVFAQPVAPPTADRLRLSLQLGHAELVSAVSLSEDDKFLLTNGEDKSAVLWDAATGAELRRYERLPCYPNAAILLKARNLFITAGRSCGGRFYVYELSTGRQLTAVPAHSGPITAMSLSPDGRLLATGGEDGQVRLWTVGAWQPAGPALRKGDEVLAVAFSPDGASLAAGGGREGRQPDTTIRVWDVRTRKQIAALQPPPSNISMPKVRGLTFLTRDRLVSVDNTDALIIWDVPSSAQLARTKVKSFHGPTSVTRLSDSRFLTADGALVVDRAAESAFTVGGRLELLVWDAGSPGSATYRLYDSSIRDSAGITFLRKGVTHTNSLINMDHAARRWTLRPDGSVTQTYVSGVSIAHEVAVSPRGDRIAAVHADGRLRLWSFDAAELVRSSAAHSGSANSVRFDPTGSRLTTTGYDAQVMSWNLASASPETIVSGLGGGHAVINTAGDRLYASFDGEISEIDPASKSVRRSWILPASERAQDLLLTPDEGMLLVSSWESGVYRIDLRGGGLLPPLPDSRGLTYLAYHPDTDVLAAGGAGSVVLWTLATGARLRAFKTHAVEDLSFSPDGRRLYIVGGRKESLTAWDVATGKLSRNFDPGRDGHVLNHTVSVFPKGDWVVTGAGDGVLRLWDARSGQLALKLFGIDDGWAVLAPDGRFDGDATARARMHWVRGYVSITLDAFMDRYFTPGLLELILSRADGGRPATAYALKPPPNTAIEGPEERAVLDQDEVDVRVIASDQGGGVDEIRLYNNGRRVTAATSVSASASAFKVRLARGRNELSAVAFSKDRVQGPAARRVVLRLIAPGVSGASKLFAAGAGIGKFASSDVKPLSFPADDARDIVTLLKSKGGAYYSSVKDIVKLDAQATKFGILGLFNQLESSAVDDTVIIMLSAHGGLAGKDWVFLPHDWNRRLDSGLTAHELAGALSRVPSQRIILFIDACHSGGALSSFNASRSSLRGATARLSRDVGLYVIAASQKDEYAQESSALRHGVLTYAALEGLEGRADDSRDGTVTAQELARYIRWRVPAIGDELSRTTGRPLGQIPAIEAIGADFPVLPSSN